MRFLLGRKSKKIVLFIVEGVSEKDSLELLMEKAFEDKNFIFEVVHGDITADKNINTKNVKEKIGNIIKAGGRNKYKPANYEEVIHLVDLDGVFLDDNHIFLDSSLEKISYREDGIYYNDIKKVIDRNEHKRDLINMLISTPYVYKIIPYSVYFFSSNLEHVLHDIIDADDGIKGGLSIEFQDRYYNDIEGFLKYMCESDFCICGDYKSSWNYIKSINDKILRASNFNLVIDKYKIKEKKVEV